MVQPTELPAMHRMMEPQKMVQQQPQMAHTHVFCRPELRRVHVYVCVEVWRETIESACAVAVRCDLARYTPCSSGGAEGGDAVAAGAFTLHLLGQRDTAAIRLARHTDTTRCTGPTQHLDHPGSIAEAPIATHTLRC